MKARAFAPNSAVTLIFLSVGRRVWEPASQRSPGHWLQTASRLAGILIGLGLALLVIPAHGAARESPQFLAGVAAYTAGDYAEAARHFREIASAQPSSGTLVNLGLAEWQQGRAGHAILAWERALWVDPLDGRARNNLQFGRASAQLEAPQLTWYEVASTWLPANWWAWVVGGSLWFVVGVTTLPGVLRWGKAPWQQALAALSLGVLLLSLPAHVGVVTRARLGFVLEKDVPLRLTPTAEAEAVTRLAAGEAARGLRTRGGYLFLQTSHARGWVRQEEFELICAP